MKKIIIILVTIIVSGNLLFAQTGNRSIATITGTVADSLTSDPMAAATISVTERATGNIIKGTIANSGGVFTIPDIPFGVYDIGISFIGYQEVRIDSISLSKDLSLGTITLSPADFSLEEVMVVSDKPVIENRLDKIVYNVSSDITSRGTLALDVLRKVPFVTVDADGNVELQGNSNIRFLINGKTSSIFGNNLADALASIPASQISSIEAITNPGAKYDLQGTGGVINIVLHENRFWGASGNVNLSAGTRNQNGSVSLGIRQGKFGVNGYLSGNMRMGTDGSYSSIREASDIQTGQKIHLSQDGRNSFQREGYRAGAGFEWDITKKISFSGSAGYNNFSFSRSGLVNLEETIYNDTGSLISESYSVRNYTNNRESGSVDWNLDIKKRFGKEGHELDIMLNSSYGKPDSYYLMSRSENGGSYPSEGSESNNPATNNTTTVSADYVYPLNDKTTIEAGVKGIFDNIKSIVSMRVYNPLSAEYVSDPLQSYDLRYTLDVYAAYLSTNFTLFNWLDMKPGARYEYSDISIDFSGASVPSYGTLVPSLLFSHSFSDNNALQLSYSRRIRRPDYGDLNPIINRSDPYNIVTGNVLLKPEVGERIELGYTTNLSKGGNLRVALSQRIDSHEIDDITTFYPTYEIGDSVYRNVSVTKNENIGSEYNTGLNIFSSIPVTSKFNLRGNLMLFYNYLVSDYVGNLSTGLRFRGNLNATWQLPSGFMLELFGFWRSGGKGIQGKEPQFYIYNFSLRKLFWDKNGSLGVTATNLFNKNIRQVRTITTENSTSRNVQELPFRSFGISFTYKFGNIQSQQDRNYNENSFGGGGD